MFLVKKPTYTDKEIIEGLLAGGRKEDSCLAYLYKNNIKSITNMIRENNGNEEEAKDIFQDAIVVFYEQVKIGKFQLEAKISTFIYTVAKNMWLNKLKRAMLDISYRNTQDKNQADDSLFEQVLEKEKQYIVYDIMNQLKEDCKQILIYTVYESRSMKEVSELMGFQNEQVARNKKSKCLNYLKNIVRRSHALTQQIQEIV